MDWIDICNSYDLAWDESERKAQELFGDKDNLPDDESEIVWNDTLYPTHETKLAALRVLRAGKQIKPKSFAKRLTDDDRDLAKGMRISLD